MTGRRAIRAVVMAEFSFQLLHGIICSVLGKFSVILTEQCLLLLTVALMLQSSGVGKASASTLGTAQTRIISFLKGNLDD
jgi:hypothetical protein